MLSLGEDQAAGLRRIFSRRQDPVAVAFAGAGGRSAIVAGIARGLAALGKEVIILDEHSGPESAAAVFDVAVRFDLMQAVNCDVPPNQVVLCAEPAIRIIPAARAARESSRLDPMQRRAVAEWLRRLQKGVDFVLVNSAGHAKGVSLLQPPPRRVVVVAATNSSGITDAYAQIKRLAQEADCRSFEVIIARAASREAGETVFANMRDVAQQHLGVKLVLMGCLPTQVAPETASQALAETLLHPASVPKAAQLAQITKMAQADEGHARSKNFLNFGHGTRNSPVANPAV